MTISEQFTTFTPLGIRFWDPVSDRQVDDGLMVKAHPLVTPEKSIQSLRTPGGIYTFSHLPGMRDIEYGLVDDESDDSPSTGHYFVIEVHDTRRRYVSVAVDIELPLSYPGVFLSNTGSPESMPRGVHLYSSVTRNIPSHMALVRGELVQHDNREPASHALVMVENGNGNSWYGVADEKGHFSVVFPYPELDDRFGGSPSLTSSGALHEQAWDLELNVFYSLSDQQSLPGTDIPSYLSILSQQPAEIWPQPAEDGGIPVMQLPVTLMYQLPAILKTDGLSKLLVSPLP